jgi:hypothetical protein
MDGRQVDHVEAHGRDLGQAVGRIGESTVLAGLPPLRAREQLVPGAEAGLQPIHDQRPQLEARGVAWQQRNADDLGHLVRERDTQALLEGRTWVGHALRGVFDTFTSVALQKTRQLDQDVGAFKQLGAHVLAGVEALAQIATERAVAIWPCLDRVLPAPQPVRFECAVPAVHVEVVRERRGAKLGRPLRPIQNMCGDQIVAVLEDVDPDLDRLAEQALDRVATPIQLGREVLDHEAGKLFGGRVHAISREPSHLPPSAPDFIADLRHRAQKGRSSTRPRLGAGFGSAPRRELQRHC